MTSKPILTLESADEVFGANYELVDLTLPSTRKNYKLVLPVDQLWQSNRCKTVCVTREGGKYGVYSIVDREWSLYTANFFRDLDRVTEEAEFLVTAILDNLCRRRDDKLFEMLAKIDAKPDSYEKRKHFGSVRAALKLRGFIDPQVIR